MKNKKILVIAIVTLLAVAILGHFIPISSKEIKGCWGYSGVETNYRIIGGDKQAYDSGKQLLHKASNTVIPDYAQCGSYSVQLYLW